MLEKDKKELINEVIQEEVEDKKHHGKSKLQKNQKNLS